MPSIILLKTLEFHCPNHTLIPTPLPTRFRHSRPLPVLY